MNISLGKNVFTTFHKNCGLSQKIKKAKELKLVDYRKKVVLGNLNIAQRMFVRSFSFVLLLSLVDYFLSLLK